MDNSPPTSLMTVTASGLTFPEGLEPAERISQVPSLNFLAHPSAIWLRQEFSIQTNNIFFMRFPAIDLTTTGGWRRRHCLATDPIVSPSAQNPPEDGSRKINPKTAEMSCHQSRG